MTQQTVENALDTKRKSRILSLAASEAIKGGLMSSGLVGAAMYFHSLRSKSFNKRMISTKVSIPVMAGLFFFTLRYEHALHDMNRRPENWGLTDKEIVENT